MKKKVYEKPTVKKVPLKPEEAALTACKSHSQVGPAGLGCAPGNICKKSQKS